MRSDYFRFTQTKMVLMYSVFLSLFIGVISPHLSLADSCGVSRKAKFDAHSLDLESNSFRDLVAYHYDLNLRSESYQLAQAAMRFHRILEEDSNCYRVDRAFSMVEDSFLRLSYSYSRIPRYDPALAESFNRVESAYLSLERSLNHVGRPPGGGHGKPVRVELITCNSNGFSPNMCRVPYTAVSVRFVQQLSKRSCEGRWSWTEYGIQVIDGCRGVFEVRYR